MASTKCFRCGQGYESSDPDDFMFEKNAEGKEEMVPTGDGKCPICKEAVAKIALAVDAKMAALRAARGPDQPSKLQLFQDAIKRGGAIRARDLQDLGFKSLENL